MSHRNRHARGPLDATTAPVPVSPALRRFAEDYFAADETEQGKGRRRSGRNVRKQVKHT
ncbi:hypothetical protein [Flindersiella endophytica]